MLADARGEDERIEAAQGHRHRCDRLRDPVAVDLEREPRVFTRIALDRLDVVGARERPEAGLVLESMVELFHGYVVPEHPADIFAAGKQNSVPLLVGWNGDEGSYFAARLKPPADGPAYVERIRAQFKEAADKVLNLYPPGATAEAAKAT